MPDFIWGVIDDAASDGKDACGITVGRMGVELPDKADGCAGIVGVVRHVEGARSKGVFA